MSVQLVIAEKPSVARSIAGVIGAGQKRDGYHASFSGCGIGGTYEQTAGNGDCTEPPCDTE